MMTERESLLQAVIDEPADDGVRLVMADWLEEHGEEDYASFIRVQIELARWDNETNVAVYQGRDLDRLAALRRLERELLDSRWVEWVRPLRPDIVDDAPIFHRGFVAAVSCTLAAWLTHGPTLVRACPLESVRLTDREPYRTGEGDGRCHWFALSAYEGPTPHHLPGDLFDLLPVTCEYAGSDVQIAYKVFPAAAAAHAALSAACIACALAQPAPARAGHAPKG